MKFMVPGLERLSTSERIQLVQDLWDSIARDPASVPLTDAQKAELSRRLAAYAVDRDPGEDWEVVKERLRSQR